MMPSNIDRRGFTLIEMLVATVLSAILMSAVLTMLAGVSRDRRSLHSLNAVQPAAGIVELMRWDICNARSIENAVDGQSLRLTGLGGIDAASLCPNGRLVQITYQIQNNHLWRTQDYLDDPARPGRWQELVAANVSDFSLDPNSGPDSPVPARIRLRVTSSGGNVNQILWIK